MMRVLLCTLLVCLALTACGGRATLDPAEVAAAVEATLTALVPNASPIRTDAPTPSSMATATAVPPTSTPVPPRISPTPAPTAVPIPRGWNQYEDFGGRFSLGYPLDWSVSETGPGRVQFRLPRGAGVIISLGEGIRLPTIGTDDDAVLGAMAAAEKTAWSDQGGDLVLTDKGIWAERGYYVMFKTKIREATSFHLQIAVPVHTDISLYLSAFRPDSDLTGNDRSKIKRVLSTVRVTPPQPTPTVEPTLPSGDETGQDHVITVLDWTWYETSDNYISIDGEIQNVSSRAIRYVKVHVKLLDANGKLLGVDIGYTEPMDIPPGGKALFSIMARSMPGLVEVEMSQVTWD